VNQPDVAGVLAIQAVKIPQAREESTPLPRELGAHFDPQSFYSGIVSGSSNKMSRH
jgi:hypothetical protein